MSISGLGNFGGGRGRGERKVAGLGGVDHEEIHLHGFYFTCGISSIGLYFVTHCSPAGLWSF